MPRNTLTFDVTTRGEQTVAELKRIQRELRATGHDAEVTGQRAKSTGLGLKGFLAGVGLVAGGKEALDQANEAQQVGRQTAAVIKSTGNAAGVSAKQQDALAQSLSKVAAVDDEVISSGANLLRRFTNISGAIFNRGLADALDLAAGKGIELNAAVQVLGKALDDPTKGMTRLTRVGITLNDQQKEQITTMQKAGDVAGAQGVILDALEKRYKGSAEAAATGSMRARVAIGNLAETAGTIAEPAIDVLGKGLQGVANTLESLPRPAQTGILALGAMALVTHKLNDSLGDRGGLKGLLTADISELGAMDTALAAGVVGIGSYSATLAFLNDHFGKFGGNTTDLAADLEGLADKSSKTSDVFAQFGGSADTLASALRSVHRDSVGSRLADLVEIRPDKVVGAKMAAADIEALDEQLATLARTNPQAAQKSVAALEAELRKSGVTTNVLIEALPQYGAELDRTKTQHLGAKQSAQEHTAAEKALTDEFRWQIGVMDALETKTKELVDGAFSDFDAARSYEASQIATKSAEDKLKFLQAAHAPKGDIQQAKRDVEESIAAQVQAKGRLMQADDQLAGKETKATDLAAAQKEELARLRTQAGITSTDLDRLGGMLDYASTYRQVQLDTKQTEANIARLKAAMIEAGLLLPDGTKPRGGRDPDFGINAGGGGGFTAPVGAIPPARDPDAGPRRSLVHIEHMHGGDLKEIAHAVKVADSRMAHRVKVGG